MQLQINFTGDVLKFRLQPRSTMLDFGRSRSIFNHFYLPLELFILGMF